MTEQAGSLNEPNLIEECADALSLETNSWPAWSWFSPAQQDAAYKKAVMSIFGVLRKRGLITGQGLELIKSEETK